MSEYDQTLFVATKRGVFAFQREGQDWRQKAHALGGQRITAVSARHGVVLAGTTGGIYRSHDLGQTWQEASAGLTVPYVRWLGAHPAATGPFLAGTEPAALFLSHDEGGHWQACPEVAELRDEYGWYLPYSCGAGCVRGFSLHGNRVYAAVEVGGLLRCDDAGEPWQLVQGSSGDPRTVSEGQIHPDVHTVAVHPSSPDLVLAPTGGGFYRSDNGGKTWTNLYDCYCRAVWLDPADADHILLGPAEGVNREGRIEESLDGGQTWRSASAGLEVPWPRHMVERFLQVDSELLAVLSNGQLLAAPLDTLAWRRIMAGVPGIEAVAIMAP